MSMTPPPNNEILCAENARLKKELAAERNERREFERMYQEHRAARERAETSVVELEAKLRGGDRG